MEKLKGPYDKMCALRSFGKTLLADHQQPIHDNDSETIEFRDQIAQRWLAEEKFCDYVETEYNSLCEQINVDNLETFATQLASFLETETESDQRLDKLERDVKELKEKHNQKKCQLVRFLRIAIGEEHSRRKLICCLRV